MKRVVAFLWLGAALAAGADLSLVSLDGAAVEWRSIQAAPVTAVLFLSAQCPVSNEYVPRLNRLAQDFAGRVNVLGVNSNSNEPLEMIRRHHGDYGLAFPVYQDPNNALADRFGATVTPEAVVVDRQGKVLYRGRIDDQQKAWRVKRSDLRLALETALAGRAAPTAQTKAFGCSIKRAEASVADLQPVDEAGYRALLASLGGRVALVNFWATWCLPCRQEMPALAALEAKYRDSGLVLVTVSADQPEQRRAAAAFLASQRIRPPAYLRQAVDDDAFIRSVSPAWSGALPALFLYRRDGELARSFLGETKTELIERELATMLP